MLERLSQLERPDAVLTLAWETLTPRSTERQAQEELQPVAQGLGATAPQQQEAEREPIQPASPQERQLSDAVEAVARAP